MKKVILAVIIALIAAPIVYSQPMDMGRMADKLKLTDQQIEKLQTLRLQNEKDMIKPQGDLKLARIELKELLMKSSVDEKAVLSKVDQISGIKSEIAKMRMQHLLAARKVLSADQVSQWMKMRHEMGRGMRGHGMMGGMMGGGMMGEGMPGMMRKDVRMEYHNMGDQENQSQQEQGK